MGQSELPRTIDEFMLPVLEALRELGGSARRDEVISCGGRTGKVSLMNNSRLAMKRPACSIAADRIRWALSYLKKIGAVDNSSRGVWAITETGQRTETQSEIDIHCCGPFEPSSRLGRRSEELNEQTNADRRG